MKERGVVMKKRKSNSPVGIFVRFFILSFIVVLAVIGIVLVKGYSFTVGKLYFKDELPYLINENNVAVVVYDTSKSNNLFEGYLNGDELLVMHGEIRESYPMTTDAYFVIRLKKGDGNYQPDNKIIDFNPLFEEDILFEVQYIRTDGYHEGINYPIVKVIRSVEELSDYYKANKDKYNLGYNSGFSDDKTGFLDACSRYDNTYFENKILLIILLEEGSGSNRHKVNKLSYLDDGTLVVNIERIVPEIGTCDMAQWHILIELEAGLDVDDESKISVVIDVGL